MKQEIKQKLEQAAIQYGRAGKLVNECYPFMDGAQTILENPQEWGLCSLEVLEATSVSVGKAWADNERLKSQLAKYREALEDVDWELADEGFANSTGEGVDRARDIIREVLKHNEQ